MHTYMHMHTACMREQLAQALAMQQVLTVERDQAREQCQLVQEREAELIKQLERLRRTHSKSISHIGTNSQTPFSGPNIGGFYAGTHRNVNWKKT